MSGHDSRQLLDRIENEIEARYRGGEDLIVLINIGGNDSLYLHEKERLNVPAKEFRENVSEILEIAKRYADDVFFVGD